MVDSGDRFALTSRVARRDKLHGAWWPTSTEIVSELRTMLTTALTQVQAVQGVTLNRDEWPGAPLMVQALTSRNPTVSWYGLIEPHLAVLHTNTARLSLLVIAPETPEDVALAAMRMACTPGNTLTTTQTMDEAYARATRESA